MDWLSKIVKAKFFLCCYRAELCFSDCVVGIWKQLCKQIENPEINGPSFEGVVKKLRRHCLFRGGYDESQQLFKTPENKHSVGAAQLIPVFFAGAELASAFLK
jgi:hypothetical protein